MKEYTVGILGATGEVGREMLKVLGERDFPAKRVRAFASARSVGKKLSFRSEEIAVEEAAEGVFRGCDIVLGAASADVARSFARDIASSGAVFIDNSSAFRHEEGVPLVVPEINPEDALLHKGLIANPNCSTIITLTAVNAIAKISRIRAMIASTYQAVSGAGIGGIRELEQQLRAEYTGDEKQVAVFPHQILYNVIPQIGTEKFEGYTSEEMKMQNEGRKIMHDPDLRVTCTCVRVPVMRSHSISVSVFTEKEVTPGAVRESVGRTKGLRLCDDIGLGVYPMPLDTSDQDLVYVGRIRRDLAFENGIALWCCGDQVRKGAATNAVQIAELLV